MFSPPPSPAVVAPMAQQQDASSHYKQQIVPTTTTTTTRRSKGRGLVLLFAGLVLVVIAVTIGYMPVKSLPYRFVEGELMASVPVVELGSSLEEVPRSNRRDLAALVDGVASAAAGAIGPAPAIPDPAFAVPNPFPQPFDASFSYNFTTAQCFNFFSNFTQTPSFRQCRPLSLLISSSNAFYAAQSNLTMITAILGGTCDTPIPEQQCIDNMDGFAKDIQSQCAQDLMSKNPLVLEALNGFQSYSMYRKAGCLRNLRANTYCYADALTTASATDLYFFNLGFGITIPRNAIPTCSACVQTLMTLYAGYAVDPKLLISETYAQGAQIAIKACGSSYAKIPEALHAGTNGALARAGVPRLFSWVTTMILVVAWTLWS
jgi:hypothetical protein